MAFQDLTPLEYLQADIACKHDKAFEKLTWNERLAHFHSIHPVQPSHFKEASNPIGLRAAVEAYKDCEAGLPTGYMVSMDACSSGLQLLSLMVSCKTSFDLCGGNHNSCKSAYVTLYDAMDTGLNIEYSDCKDAVMHAFYGSEATPKRVFKGDINSFYETVEKEAPGAWDLNLALQNLWNDVKDSEYNWNMPDGFNCHVDPEVMVKHHFAFSGQLYEVMQAEPGRPKFHKALCPNLVHS